MYQNTDRNNSQRPSGPRGDRNDSNGGQFAPKTVLRHRQPGPRAGSGHGAPHRGSNPNQHPNNNRPIQRSSGTQSHRTSRRMDKKPTLTHTRGESSQRKMAGVPPLAPGDIRIIPLGGVEEIGRNMTAVEMNDQIVVIDAGIGFSDEDTPGIDYLVANTSYLEENKHKVKALVITHGHLDHIGGIPYIYNRIGQPPIYARQFGALLIKSKCSEFPDVRPTLVIAEQNDGVLPISPDFKVRFFGLTHSIPDSTGVILETPYGDIVSTGDVRVDNIDGVPLPKEFEQYAFFKDRKVLLMTMDSTGIPYPGWSYSESQVVETLDGIIKNATGRLIIGTFASQVERIIEFIVSAKKYGKYVVIEGRSMKTNLGIAEELKLTDFSHVIPIEDMDKYPPHRIVVLATGAQGEEFAALMRISNKTHKFIRLNESDSIVLSSSVIPGNESAVDKLKDNLYRNDARVITYMDNVVHASGHGKRGELEWLHKQISYKFFMPIHGHHHRLKMHTELAQSLGFPKEHCVVPDNGSIIEIRDGGNTIIKLDMKVPSDPLIIDGLSISDSQHLVIRDRKLLAQDGIFVIVALVDMRAKKLKKSPDLISRGFVYLKENQTLLQKTRMLIKTTIEESIANMNPIDFDMTRDNVSKKVGKYLLQNTAKRPVVIPVIIGI